MLSVETAGKQTPRGEKVQLKVSQFMHYTHSCENKGVVTARNFIGGLQCHTFRILGSDPASLSMPSTPVYADGQIPINKKKMEDLVKLKQYLPQDEEIQGFYNEIYSWPTCDKENIE